MAILVLLLCCVPCSDAVACAMERQHEALHKGETPDSHDRGAEHKDICSPFCQCACCAIAYALPVSNQIPASCNNQTGSRSYASLIPGLPADRPIPVWQPPQLV